MSVFAVLFFKLLFSQSKTKYQIMEKPTPRINSKLREKYVGRTIRMSGKVVSVSAFRKTDAFKVVYLTMCL
jgi:DNA-directed RNA polymerase subunit E'/Rpb7